MNRRPLTRFAWLAIGAAILTIALKVAAYVLTGSVGLLSDAMESFVNLAGGLMALTMLIVAARPPDDDHAFGHGKAEYFSSIFEGALILVAAGAIGVAAAPRLVHPRPLEQIGLGLVISVVAALVNLGVGLVLLRAGKRHLSIALEANAHHLLTDVWTSAGVLVGVGVVALTGWQRLDPIIALIVAGNIVATGVRLVRRSVSGLMDTALPLKINGRCNECSRSLLTPVCSSTRFVLTRPERVDSSHSMSWFRGTGPCIAATACSSASKRTFAARCHTLRYLRTLNP